ncbi:hypothetical protein ACWDYJ_09225 [Streptomyces sp. NPDC003042]
MSPAAHLDDVDDESPVDERTPGRPGVPGKPPARVALVAVMGGIIAYTTTIDHFTIGDM